MQKQRLSAAGVMNPKQYLVVKTCDGRIIFQHRETGEFLVAGKENRST